MHIFFVLIDEDSTETVIKLKLYFSRFLKTNFLFRNMSIVGETIKNPPVTLADPKAIYKLKIKSRELITHDTVRFVIELPSPHHVLGTKPGQHFWVIAQIDGETVSRKYTPLDLIDHRGTFETVVKVYRSNHHMDFPKGGRMTQYLETLQAGDFISIQGPIGRCVYLGNGDFELKVEKTSPKFNKHTKYIGLIAGGSGKSIYSVKLILIFL